MKRLTKNTRSLNDWLNVIEHHHPASIKLGLDRVNALVSVYRLTHFSAPVITVTGTNGKGSCIAYLESILDSAGYQVAAYTSPHLYCFNERLRINKKMLNDDAWCQAFHFIEQAVKQRKLALTFFEFITMSAFYILQQKTLDCILLEVGLGGRLDAVNSVDPSLAIITTIGLDHQHYLGTTREAIGYEKAGIFRAGRPAIIGDRHPPQSVIDHAKKLSVTLKAATPMMNAMTTNKPLIQPSADCALTALKLLSSDLPVKEDAIKKGLSTTLLKGRLQSMPGPCSIILDVAHNPCAALWLNEQLKQLPKVKKTQAIFSMLNDKDIVATIASLEDTIDQWFIAPLTDTPRAASIDQLLAAFHALGISQVNIFPSIQCAYQAAINYITSTNEAAADARLVVFGSFHTVAAIPLG